MSEAAKSKKVLRNGTESFDFPSSENANILFDGSCLKVTKSAMTHAAISVSL